MNQGYCEKCDDLVTYKTKEKYKETEIRGKRYKYKKVLGYCDKCGSEISSNEILDENLNRLDRVFREKEHIIFTDEINQILIKYKIGKKPLSKLLGWGEVTLIRYLNGDVPTKAYSDQLYHLLNDTEYMENILEKNKDLISAKAYKNAKDTISKLNKDLFRTDTSNEIEIIAEYIIKEGEDVTQLALQKMLYYAQGFYKAFYGKYLFKDDCKAWVHGPVYPTIYEKYKCFKYNKIDINIDYDVADMISDDKKKVLDAIIKFFGYYNGKALEEMSHFEEPWIEARVGLKPAENSNKIIKKEALKNYFEKVKVKYDMINIGDIRKYSEDQLKKVLDY